ncbi:MAG: LPS export ABC transporter periplasmic protein LptC [Kiritimatiellae bacterium]|nr:LPS export ABC transporter periplasmic protein LptC [Kiritimatiellia bacterium]MCO5069508.1 LPS export ABC transporter periplasmic protein LptC [Kiritimatiellia bacterium]
MRRALLGASVIGLLAVGFALAQAGDEAQTVTGFRVPTYDGEGRLTSQLFGDSARILPDGAVEIAELRMEFYTRVGDTTNRALDMRVTSPRCFYNRNTGIATSDAPVRISRDNMVVTGVGFRWSGNEERLEIYEQSKVVLKNVKRGMNLENQP